MLEKMIAEKSDIIGDGLTAKLSRIVEKAKSEHNGDLDAWYKEIYTRERIRFPDPSLQRGISIHVRALPLANSNVKSV